MLLGFPYACVWKIAVRANPIASYGNSMVSRANRIAMLSGCPYACVRKIAMRASPIAVRANPIASYGNPIVSCANQIAMPGFSIRMRLENCRVCQSDARGSARVSLPNTLLSRRRQSRGHSADVLFVSPRCGIRKFKDRHDRSWKSARNNAFVLSSIVYAVPDGRDRQS
jgi:hypothetical protein